MSKFQIMSYYVYLKYKYETIKLLTKVKVKNIQERINSPSKEKQVSDVS